MDADIIRAFPFLREVPETSRSRIAAQAVRKTLTHKDVLVRDGKECAYLPFVLRGALRVYKSSTTGRELTFYRIEKGESCILTATCILSNGLFPAVAEAEGATEVLLVPSALLLHLVDTSPAVRNFVFAQFSRRLESALTLVEEVAFHHIDARIAALLLREAGADSGTVRRTHSAIADELGTSREVVSRILKDFESAGIVSIARGSIRVLRAAALQERLATPPV
jgi:CRP/FNR family transcriptional regulator, anaerobic regulatory protein